MSILCLRTSLVLDVVFVDVSEGHVEKLIQGSAVELLSKEFKKLRRLLQ